ncbi:MAG: glycosyltransferase [Fimbriimonadaceae bacterium]|nr:glycosyltransferase [Fimbriimonadaceae bacterium]
MPARDIRVLYVVQSARMYGSQRSLLDMIVGLRGHGVVPSVAIPETGPLTDALQELEVPIHVLPLRNWLNNRGYFQAIRKRMLNRVQAKGLAQLARSERIDLIHTNTIILPTGAMAARELGIPHLWHAREQLRSHGKPLFLRPDARVRALVAETTHAVITPSPTNVPWLRRYVPESLIRAIPNGPLDEEAKQPFVPKPPLEGRPAKIVVIGRLGPQKGTEDAMRAAALLKEQGIATEWTFVGSGEPNYEAKLADLVGELEIKGTVRFAGFQRDVAPYYREADIVVMPSHAETFGRVTAEAMGFGCPLVATRIPATQEIVEEGQTGLLYAVGQAQDLANAIGVLTENAELRSELDEAGYREAWGRFTRQRLGREIAGMYAEALGCRR